MMHQGLQGYVKLTDQMMKVGFCPVLSDRFRQTVLISLCSALTETFSRYPQLTFFTQAYKQLASLADVMKV